MTNTRLLATVALAIVAVSLSAQVPNDQSNAFRNRGYLVNSVATEAGIPVYDVVDPDGNEISVRLLGSLTADRAVALDELRSVVFALPGLTVQRSRVLLDPELTTMVVVPEQFLVDGEDYLQYMPAGMQFLYDLEATYDFRLLVDNLAVRISGLYVDSDDFLERLRRAVENPLEYIQTSDPQFLAELIRELQAELQIARYGAVVASARGLFGSRPVSSEQIQAAVDLKSENGALTVDEVVRQVNEQIEADSNLHARHVEAIFAVYFNEFE